MAVGVILNLIISTNPFLAIILLQVTPTANRNSYRVAILVGALPRVAGCARNPGLCNRNSVRVARGAYQPTAASSQPSPRGRSTPATLGYVIATLSELPGVRTSQLRPHPTPTTSTKFIPMKSPYPTHWLPISSGNSVGVAVPQPRVEGRSTSTLG